MNNQVAVALLIAIKRPRSSPSSLLLYFLVTVSTELLLFTGSYDISSFKIGARYVAIGSAIAAAAVVLWMPCRDPSLPPINISGVGQVPNSHWRSPEDNLRLWQFLTVSWMAPLMLIGRRRQLHEDDVWYLGYEFQHRRLHEKFRLLRGSVLRRVLKANGIDVLIVTTLATVQMFCGLIWRTP